MNTRTLMFLSISGLARARCFPEHAERAAASREIRPSDVQALLARWPDVSTWFVGHFGPLTRAAVQAKFGAKP